MAALKVLVPSSYAGSSTRLQQLTTGDISSVRYLILVSSPDPHTQQRNAHQAGDEINLILPFIRGSVEAHGWGRREDGHLQPPGPSRATRPLSSTSLLSTAVVIAITQAAITKSAQVSCSQL